MNLKELIEGFGSSIKSDARAESENHKVDAFKIDFKAEYVKALRQILWDSVLDFDFWASEDDRWKVAKCDLNDFNVKGGYECYGTLYVDVVPRYAENGYPSDRFEVDGFNRVCVEVFFNSELVDSFEIREQDIEDAGVDYCEIDEYVTSSGYCDFEALDFPKVDESEEFEFVEAVFV